MRAYDKAKYIYNRHKEHFIATLGDDYDGKLTKEQINVVRKHASESVDMIVEELKDLQEVLEGAGYDDVNEDIDYSYWKDVKWDINNWCD